MRFFRLSILFFVAALLQPLHLPPWVSWHSEVLIFAGVIFVVLRHLVRSDQRGLPAAMAFPAAALPLFFMGILVCLQWTSGLLLHGGDAFVYCAYLLLCVVCMALGFTGAEDAEGLTRPLAYVLAFCALGSSTIAFAQVFGVADVYSWIHQSSLPRPGANLGQPNQLATLLLMGLVSVGYLFERRKIGVLPAAMMASVIVVAVAATESRAGVLSFLVLMLWWFAKRKVVAPRLNPWVLGLMGFAFLCIYGSWPVLLAEVFQTTGQAPAVNTAAYNRWAIWPQLVQAACMRPWLGWGFGQVSTAHNAVADAYSFSEPYTYAHNIVLDFSIGVGLPLTLLLTVVVCMWMWRRMREIREPTPWYCLAVVIPVAVHSLVEFPYAYAYFLVPVMLAIGVLEKSLAKPSAFSIGVKPLVIGLSITTALVVWSVIEYVAIEEDFRVVRFEALHYGQTPSSYQRPTVYLFTQLDALLNGGRIEPRPNMPAQEIELARVVALRFPWPATQYRYAMTLALNGNPTEAVRQLRVMKALHGKKYYAQLKQNWIDATNEKYPQLAFIQLP